MAYLHDPTYIEIEGKKHRIKDFEKQREAGAEPFQMVFLLTTNKVETNTAYAFHTQKSARVWLKERDLADWYRDFGKAPKIERTKKELAQIRELQEAEISHRTKRFEADVARIGIDPSKDIRGFCRAVERFDPMRGPVVGSVVLFEHCPFWGRALSIPSYLQICDLRFLTINSYDRIASSVITSPTRGCFLWNRLNGPMACPFTGMPLGVMIGALRAVSCLTALGFNDLTRSVTA